MIFLKIGSVKLILLMGEGNLSPYMTYFVGNLGKMCLNIGEFRENPCAESRILLSRELRVGSYCNFEFYENQGSENPIFI